jgi:CHASE2 domain-containing sensor protein
LLARLKTFWHNWKGVLIVAPSATALVVIVRLLGWLEPLEWTALDRFFQFRPLEPPDKRIVIVGITEKDIQKYQPYPFTDATLAKLLTKIKAQKPLVIGLDLIRDIPIPPGSNELIEVFKTTPNLIGVGKLTGMKGDDFFTQIPFPPVLEQRGQVADISAIVDQDGVTRRAILYPLRDNSPKSTVPSLGLAVAYQYLTTKKIYPQASSNGGWLQLDRVVFYPFQENDGGYIRADDVSYQILMNWRGPAESFKHVSVVEVMEGRIDPTLFKDRIVLIGAYAPSLKDGFLTPYSKGEGTTPKKTYGVEIQANLASQILSTVLDGRSLIKVWRSPVEYLWISIWALLPAVSAWKWRNSQNYTRLTLFILMAGLLLTVGLIGGSYLAFLQVWWIPVVPALFSIWGATLGILGYIYIDRLAATNAILESQVEARTLELSQKNRELEATLYELRQAQQKLISQEKLASLGTLVGGIAHEIRNPVNLIKLNTQLSSKVLKSLEQGLQELQYFFEDLSEDLFSQTEENLASLGQKLVRIETQATRTEQIVQNILSYAKRETGEISLTDINSLIAESLELVAQEKQAACPGFSCHYEINCDRTLEPIKVFERDMRRVFVNLIENAWDAVEEKQKRSGEGYIPTIAIATENLGSAIAIVIRDNGDGIACEICSKIFDPFFTKKTSGKGTGLGLFFVHEIVVGEHLGEIKVETEIGKGSKFSVVLPRKLAR